MMPFVSKEFLLVNDKNELFELSDMPDYYAELQEVEDTNEFGTRYTWCFYPKLKHKNYDPEFKKEFWIVYSNSVISIEEVLKEHILSDLDKMIFEVLNLKKINPTDYEKRLCTNRKPRTVSLKGD